LNKINIITKNIKMRKLFSIFTVLAFGFIILSTSCKKDRDEEDATPTIPSDYTTTSIQGVVYDESHYVLSGVDITIGSTTFTTNWDGSFFLKNISVNKNRFLAKFHKTNYFETVRTEKTASGGISRLDVTMVSKSSASSTSFSPSFGGDLTLYTSYSNGMVHFPAGLNYIDADGNDYTGNVNVYAKFLDPTDDNYSRYAPGGDQFGLFDSGSKSTMGDDVYLMSIGGMLIELTDDSGNLLNLSENNDSTVTIDTPIPSVLQTMAPDTIDSWYIGGDMAYSSNEGSGRKEGGKYISQVSHFSFWSLEIPYSGSATIKGQVKDDSGNSIPGIRVRVGQSYAVTDNDGYYERIVPAGISGIIVEVMGIDFNSYSSSQYIQSSLSDGQIQTVDITVTIPAGSMRVITGRLVNCSSTSISGNISASQGYSSNYTVNTFTQDGTFSIVVPSTWTSITLKCTANNMTKDVYVYPSGDPYDVGDILFCPPPTGSNEVTIDGAVYGDFAESHAHINTSMTQLYIDASGTDRSFYFYIDNFTSTGTYQFSGAKSVNTSGDVNVEGSYYNPETGSITVTQFDAVGGRVIGTFTFSPSTGETITGKFNSLRDEDQTR
jgi:hypothetical protein